MIRLGSRSAAAGICQNPQKHRKKLQNRTGSEKMVGFIMAYVGWSQAIGMKCSLSIAASVLACGQSDMPSPESQFTFMSLIGFVLFPQYWMRFVRTCVSSWPTAIYSGFNQLLPVCISVFGYGMEYFYSLFPSVPLRALNRDLIDSKSATYGSNNGKIFIQCTVGK